MRTRSCARANDAKIVCSRDTQCSTKESPEGPKGIKCFSLFQALGQWDRSKKRARDKQGLVKKNGRACKHCFKNLILPTFKKITLQGCQMSKCQNISIFGVELLVCVSPFHSVLDVVLANFTGSKKNPRTFVFQSSVFEKSLTLASSNVHFTRISGSVIHER